MVIVVNDAAAESHPPLSSEPLSVPPPTVTSSSELPFDALDWERFERLCRDTAKAEGLRNVYRYGKPGQKQHGIDFRGTTIDGHRMAFQVRRVRQMTDADLRAAVGNFAQGPHSSRTDTFVICMSVEGNEAGFKRSWPNYKSQRSRSFSSARRSALAVTMNTLLGALRPTASSMSASMSPSTLDS